MSVTLTEPTHCQLNLKPRFECRLAVGVLFVLQSVSIESCFAVVAPVLDVEDDLAAVVAVSSYPYSPLPMSGCWSL